MLVCCVGLTGSEFVLPTTAWDLTCKAKLILVVITWLIFFVKKYQIPEWTTQTTTELAQANMLKAESADHIKHVQSDTLSTWVLQVTNYG